MEVEGYGRRANRTPHSGYIHMRGTTSDVSGMLSVTIFKNTVRESSIVTPAKEKNNLFTFIFLSESAQIKCNAIKRDLSKG